MLISWIFMLALSVAACTHPLGASHQRSLALTLTDPVQVRTDTVTLAVGTNHWSGKNASLLEDTFLPLAVTVRNTSTKTLCGGIATATLSDATGTSSSAIFPEGVVTKLIGPLASFDPLFLPTGNDTVTTHEKFFLLRVGGRGGRIGGGGGYGGGFPGQFGGVPYFGGYPRSSVPPSFGWPSYSPFAPFPLSPFSPFSSPFPSPFPPPWSSPPRFGDLPYRYIPLPPSSRTLPREEPQETNVPALKEIFTIAFASRSLAAQEERSGFLFFQLPIPQSGATTLTWDWYDCSTHELVAHLAIPVNPKKRL